MSDRGIDAFLEPEPYSRPFRKFAAGADWLKIGPIVTSPRDDYVNHEHLDERTREPGTVFGWLRIDESRVEVDAPVGSP